MVDHLAISVGSESVVAEPTARLRAAAVPILDGPRRTGEGYYGSHVPDPEGSRIELAESVRGVEAAAGGRGLARRVDHECDVLAA
ncbi:hypothetical protein [Aquisphaera insulae]|uniref:hypothetical protein n=1 Tax=Aquisphaera insulae TaxID=2712864 RepID=UPI0034E252F3